MSYLCHESNVLIDEALFMKTYMTAIPLKSKSDRALFQMFLGRTSTSLLPPLRNKTLHAIMMFV
jgi:hypothetical protein